MKIQEYYNNGYIYEKDGKDYLNLKCSNCGSDMIGIWIIKQKGNLIVPCVKCGKDIYIEIVEEKEK